MQDAWHTLKKSSAIDFESAITEMRRIEDKYDDSDVTDAIRDLLESIYDESLSSIEGYYDDRRREEEEDEDDDEEEEEEEEV